MPFCLHVLLLLSTTAFPSSNLDLARVREEQRQRVEVFAKAAESVVLIYPNAAREGGGSGVLIDADGYGVTNFHVVAEFVQQGGYGALADGKLYPLTVLGIDPGGDVAMFKLEGRDEFPFAPFGPKSLPRLGQTVAAMGNPFVLSENYDPTISMGVISGLHRYQEGQENLLEYADCIQVSTSINPGNSGGPLFDLDGHVIGINGRASFEERGRVNVGLGYAITTQQIKRFIPALRAGLLTQHGTLGATVQLAGDDLIVDAIQQLSPAERVGIEIGDVVVAIQGQPVRTPNEYNNVVAPMPADWPVTVTLKRGNT
ncbi:MAG: S1C family serine protease, partial [Phycisphaerae bacterium]